MKAWLYARLSNDDDPEMDSLANQMEICKEYALGKGYSIAGSSFDDNISGMKFNRCGLAMLTDAVETGQVDAMIIKDLSRLGRHKIQTAYGFFAQPVDRETDRTAAASAAVGNETPGNQCSHRCSA